MPEDQLSPEITVRVALSPPLDGITATSELRDLLRERLSRGVTELLQSLGLPGRPRIELMDSVASSLRFPLTVSVHDRKCRYPAELVDRVYRVVTAEPYGAASGPEDLESWLATPPREQDLVEFVSLTCLEAMSERASVLLSPAQALAYVAGLPDGFTPPDEQWLVSVLGRVLDLGLSVADRAIVSWILAKGQVAERSWEEVAEDLIAGLQTGVIDIRLPLEDLKGMTTGDTAAEHTQFPLLRDTLFYEFGLRYPEFRFVTANDLRPGTVAFTINNLTTVAGAGVRPDHVLANETPEQLRVRGIEGRPALTPSGAAGSNVAALHRGALEGAGLKVWGAVDYVVRCLSATLRRRRACFVHRGTAEEMLEQLEQAFPSLVRLVRSKFSIDRVVCVLRELVAEQVSVRKLKLILECMLDCDGIPADPTAYDIFDDRLPVGNAGAANLTSFVRSGMKSYLSDRYAPGRKVSVYLLAPEIEQRVSAQRDSRAFADDTILAAVRRGIDFNEVSGRMPVVLTTPEVRPLFRKLIVDEYPWLPVLAYPELLPDLNILPIGRISLEA